MARFSLKWLLLAVACIGICIAALLNAGSVWAGLFFFTFQLTIFAAIVGAVANRSRQFCLAYGAVALIYWFTVTSGSVEGPTTLLLDKLYLLLFKSKPSDNYFQFGSIGHSVLAMGFGCVAGWAAMGLSRRP